MKVMLINNALLDLVVLVFLKLRQHYNKEDLIKKIKKQLDLGYQIAFLTDR